MFWADRLAGEIQEKFRPFTSDVPLVIRDEKTLSGRVHVGSMRGAAVHGTIAEALTKLGVPNTFLWEHNDFDVMDDVPAYLPREQFEKYLGRLLCDVPSPALSAEEIEGSGPWNESYAEYFGKEFEQVITSVGWKPQFYFAKELYVSGKMDEVIREALQGASSVRRIYKEVSGGERNESWLPINVICPECRKIATTESTDWDGSTVLVECKEKKAPYTKGCGFEGRVCPFGGAAKLPWKVEWPAKWKVMNVQVEGAGKDHSTKGGSRDVANHIAREVFNYEPPFDAPYEFFLVGGKKMSSSKGRGSSAAEIAELLPPKIFRLALLSKDINQAFNFDPEGDTIPVLFDLYDKLREGYTTNTEDDYARLFEYVHLGGAVSTASFMPRFSQVAFMVQMPHMNLEDEMAALKGAALTDADKAELSLRAEYAKRWLELCAPEKFVFKLQESLPEAVGTLTSVQKQALASLAAFVEARASMPSGEELHHELHEMKERIGIAPAELFSSIYMSFLGKGYGPKAGWFLSVLERDFVLKRLKEASV